MARTRLVNGVPVPLTPAEEAARDAEEAAWQPRRQRRLLDIRADLAALTAAQRNAVWAAFTAGTPPLWATDAGPNAAALAAVEVLARSAALPAADVLEAKLRAVAFYVQDNPAWLVNPPFAPAVNVPGDEVAA